MKLEDIKEKMRGKTYGSLGIVREFAILILLTEKEDGLHFVFEKRAGGIKQPGDICFPGGKVEPGESYGECALRETWEEVGLRDVELIGEYRTQYELTSIAMHSLVGFVKEEKLCKMRINEREVAEVFTVPLAFFAENEPYIYEYDVVQNVEDFPYERFGVRSDYKWRVGRKAIPLYEYGDRLIWGLTAAFVKQFVEEFLRNSAKNPRF